MNIEVEKYPGELKALREKAKTLDELVEVLAETLEHELLEEIGRDKCVKHFDLKLRHEEEWCIVTFALIVRVYAALRGVKFTRALCPKYQ